MAEVAFTRGKVGPWDTFTWSGVTEADTFQPVRLEGAIKAATFQCSGTFGGASLVLQGSNDATTWAQMDDVEDVAILHTDAGGSEVRYAWPYYRPNASGGTSQDIDAILAVMVEPA